MVSASTVVSRIAAWVGKGSLSRRLAIAAFFIVAIRGMTLDVVDLIDPTESRYALVSQEMFFSGDWVTPKLPENSGDMAPYLGKPPLHFWLTAITYKIFGMDEWATRLVSFFGFILVMAAASLFAYRFFGARCSALAALITGSSGLLFFLGGASVGDVTLAAAISSAMLAFAFRCEATTVRRARLWQVAFHVALALGMLTKGPVALALPATALLCWAGLNRKRWHKLLRICFSPIGIFAFLAVCAPWFIIAQQHNPDFLSYFFLSENFGRYLQADYGDRYGTGHRYPIGSAWWMLALGFAPWTFLFPLLLRKDVRSASLPLIKDSWTAYAISWGLSPAIFFTLVKQMHSAYVIPGTAGLAVATALLIMKVEESPAASDLARRVLVTLTSIVVVVAAVSFPAASVIDLSVRNLSFAVLTVIGSFAAWKALNLRECSLTTATAQLALLISVAYGVCTFLWADYAGSRKSTAQILSAIAQKYPEKSLSVGIMSPRAYSHYFYGRAEDDTLPRPVTMVMTSPEKAADTPLANLILTTTDLARNSGVLLAHFKVELRINKWVWMTRKYPA